MKQTLFDWVDALGQPEVARLLSVDRTNIGKTYAGLQGVSSKVHAKAVETWGDAYDMGGTTAESLKRLGLLPSSVCVRASDAV